MYDEGASAAGILKVKNSSLEMLIGVCGASFVRGVRGLSVESCLKGTSNEGRELEVAPESWRNGLSNGRLKSKDGPLALLSGLE
jgi:hypothetical protein